MTIIDGPPTEFSRSFWLSFPPFLVPLGGCCCCCCCCCCWCCWRVFNWYWSRGMLAERPDWFVSGLLPWLTRLCWIVIDIIRRIGAPRVSTRWLSALYNLNCPTPLQLLSSFLNIQQQQQQQQQQKCVFDDNWIRMDFRPGRYSTDSLSPFFLWFVYNHPLIYFEMILINLIRLRSGVQSVLATFHLTRFQVEFNLIDAMGWAVEMGTWRDAADVINV